MTLRFVVCAGVTAFSAIVSLGFSLAAVLNADGEAKTMALYACARSIALVLVSAGPLFTVSIAWLLAGPALTALLNLAAIIWLAA